MTELLREEWLDPIISRTYDLALAFPGELLASSDDGEDITLLRLSVPHEDLSAVVALPCNPSNISERSARILLQGRGELRLIDLSPDGAHIQRTLGSGTYPSASFPSLLEQPPCHCNAEELASLRSAIECLYSYGEVD